MTQDELTKWENEFDKVTHIKIVAMVNVNGYKYFEIHLLAKHPEEPMKYRHISNCKFPLSTAKRLEITKSLNGSTKMEIWLNSEFGLRYVINEMKANYRRDFEALEIQRKRLEMQDGT